MKRHRTEYPGVFYRKAQRIGGPGMERVYYIVFKDGGQTVEEKAGRQYADDMTPAKAAGTRSDRIEGRRKSRKEIRQKAKDDKAAKDTLGDVWPEYVKANRHRWSSRYLLDHERAVDPGGRKAKRAGKGETIKPGTLAPLVSKRLSEITPEVVEAWLKGQAAGRPTQAHIAFGLLRAFLNWCADHPDYRDMAHPEACGRRVKRLVLPPKNARDDCLQREQLRPWFEAVKKLPNPVAVAYLQGLLLTGARRSELAALTWETSISNGGR